MIVSLVNCCSAHMAVASPCCVSSQTGLNDADQVQTGFKTVGSWSPPRLATEKKRSAHPARAHFSRRINAATGSRMRV